MMISAEQRVFPKKKSPVLEIVQKGKTGESEERRRQK